MSGPPPYGTGPAYPGFQQDNQQQPQQGYPQYGNMYNNGSQQQYGGPPQQPSSQFSQQPPQPGPGMYQNQQYPDNYNSYGMHGGAPQYGQQSPAPDQAFTIPGLNGPALNPLGMLAAGSNLLSGGQTWGTQYMQRVQQRMGWLSGGALNYYFAISNQYVANKLVMLLVPFLRKWSYSRQPEQIQGGQRYRPPRVDVAAPDLYIPLVSAWAYVTLLCLNALLLGKYKPELVYTKVWWTGFAWVAHSLAAWVLLRMMSLPTSLPWGELFAYTGYVFVPACSTLILGMVAGKWGWWAGWAYGSLCSAVFLVRTIKRVLFQEARNYGLNLTLTNYLLLALAAAQFPLMLWLCHAPLPNWSLHLHVAATRVPAAVKTVAKAAASPAVVSPVANLLKRTATVAPK